MDFERVDMREMTPEEMVKAGEMAKIIFWALQSESMGL